MAIAAAAVRIFNPETKEEEKNISCNQTISHEYASEIYNHSHGDAEALSKTQ